METYWRNKYRKGQICSQMSHKNNFKKFSRGTKLSLSDEDGKDKNEMKFQTLKPVRKFFENTFLRGRGWKMGGGSRGIRGNSGAISRRQQSIRGDLWKFYY